MIHYKLPDERVYAVGNVKRIKKRLRNASSPSIFVSISKTSRTLLIVPSGKSNISMKLLLQKIMVSRTLPLPRAPFTVSVVCFLIICCNRSAIDG